MSDTPDLTCDNPDCPIHDKMEKMAEKLVPPPDDESTSLINQFFDTYQTVLNNDPSNEAYQTEVALPALFDLIISGHYAAALEDPTWTYCEGKHDEDPAVYSPFLKDKASPDRTTCPRCAGRHDEQIVIASNKPESDNIGMDSESATVILLSKIIEIIGSGAEVYNSTARRGDVDVVVNSEEVTVLAELKSSPLFPLPLEIKWTDLPNSTTPGDHEPIESPSPNLSTANMSFYLPHKDRRINVGPRDNDRWPFPELEERFSDPDTLGDYLTAWKEIYDVYEQKLGLYGDEDGRRWLHAGCGGETSDSKQKPGLDRTDDIKKGTYQLVKYTTSYKDQCPEDHIRSALVSNFFPTRVYERYYEDMDDLVLVKPEHELDGDTSDDVRAFEEENIYNLFDSVLGLTDALYNDEEIRDLVGPDALEEELMS